MTCHKCRNREKGQNGKSLQDNSFDIQHYKTMSHPSTTLTHSLDQPFTRPKCAFLLRQHIRIHPYPHLSIDQAWRKSNCMLLQRKGSNAFLQLYFTTDTWLAGLIPPFYPQTICRKYIYIQLFSYFTFYPCNSYYVCGRDEKKQKSTKFS